MPNLPPRPCAHPGCRNIATTDGRCEHHPRPHNWPTQSRHERGYDRHWDVLRQQILDRDRHMCQPCLQDGIYTQAKEVDHKVPKSAGGTDDPDNLQAICRQCHREKSKRERIAARWPQGRTR